MEKDLSRSFRIRTSHSGMAQPCMPLDKGEKYHTADCKLSGDAKDMNFAAAKKAGGSLRYLQTR